jgi:hydroxymethylpyrimidine/phosphomethylpyrimidine kinase
MERLFNNLSTIIVKNLELAKEVEINPENDLIHARIVNSVFMDLFMNELGLKSIHLLGCPLASAIACSLAEATGKLVSIVKDAVSSDLRTIEVWYKTLEA